MSKRLVIRAFVVVAALAVMGFAGPVSGEAGQGSGHADPIAPLLLALTVILLSAKIAGSLFERMGQPAVLGELLAGVVLGNLVLIDPSLGFFEPLKAEPISIDWAVAVDHLSRLGVILLLFDVGLESSFAEMRKVGTSSLLVAAVGVVAPFFIGYAVSSAFITEVPAAIREVSPNFDLTNIHLFIGATLCATSVGITARVFRDLGKIQTSEAKIILGAAVIDDVLGLIILAVVSGVVTAAETGSTLDIWTLVRIAATAVGFLVGALVIGTVVVPRVMKGLAKFRTGGMMLIAALLFCFVMSYLANLAGLATIVGAFAAGLILEEVHFTDFKEPSTLHERLTPVGTLLIPIFFVQMGIQVRLETFLKPEVVGLALGLSIAAVIGKQLCGLAVVERAVDRLTVGLGMIPRGEVGLIFAAIGKSLGVVDDAVFSAVVIMVIVTTLATPPLLKYSLARFERKGKVRTAG
jgi:Kef-type K+ transport system membrane component KefB